MFSYRSPAFSYGNPPFFTSFLWFSYGLTTILSHSFPMRQSSTIRVDQASYTSGSVARPHTVFAWQRKNLAADPTRNGEIHTGAPFR